ncbi:LysR family transcriptional regulator substrate-binding protein, partial [Terrisporobacter sp.]|uniref:LysR family transcriptional regulator substrate-binding protein n=1 Tax=Terrisporobacter sp. TaxID=1965305 RepID=UPI0026283416
DELVLITSKKHNFSNKKYVNLKDASEENFIFLSSPSGMDSFCISQCNRHGFAPNVVYSVNKIETILGLVEENFGITMLMRKTVSCFNNDKISINLLKQPVTNNLSLVYRKDKLLSENENLFKNFIIESTKEE